MEQWIWTELLAFNREESDRGVARYLETIGFVPTGISLLLTAIDFVMQHDSFDPSRRLPPDVCARKGHGGNENRRRQEWHSGELRELIGELRKRGIKVFFSLFTYYLEDRFHSEFASAHPECRVVNIHCGRTNGINLLSRLDSGEYFDDLFAKKLEHVLTDYGFDGFHGPDGMGPFGRTIATIDYSSGMLAQFREYLGEQLTPELAVEPGDDLIALQTYADAVWRCRWREWCDFYSMRWTQCWGKIIASAHAIGKETMMNSPNTKGVFDGLYQYGIDYAALGRLGLTYLMVETVAAGFRILDGSHEFKFDYNAQLLEFSAAMPDTRILFLHGVKDVAESYDLLRHAPSWIEGDFYSQCALFRRQADKLVPAAQGFMVCLGDGLESGEWAQLRRIWHDSITPWPVKQAGDILWVWSSDAMEGLRRSYPLHGDLPGYKVIAELTRHFGGVAQTVVLPQELDQPDQPLVIPNAEFLDQAELKRLLSYPVPILLLGKLRPEEYPQPDGIIRCSGCAMTALLYHLSQPFATEEIVSEPDSFQARSPDFNYTVLPDYMPIPEQFFRRCAELLARECKHEFQLAGEHVQLTRMQGESSIRVGILSLSPGYLSVSASDFLVGRHVTFRAAPSFRKVRKISSFPYTELSTKDGALISDSDSPVNIAPYGVLLLEFSATHGDSTT